MWKGGNRTQVNSSIFELNYIKKKKQKNTCLAIYPKAQTLCKGISLQGALQIANSEFQLRAWKQSWSSAK